MTTLLIDNYDTFTFNLVQLLASLGERVQVLKNDDRQGWESADWLTVDRIVVSPGPGNPAVPADLGLSQDAVLSRRRPLLGVCLGHRALCYMSGSVIGRAPTPVHGRTSRIVHAGDDLFAGVPTDFLATRYHSLIVEKLSDELACIAERRRPCDGSQAPAVGGLGGAVPPGVDRQRVRAADPGELPSTYRCPERGHRSAACGRRTTAAPGITGGCRRRPGARQQGARAGSRCRGRLRDPVRHDRRRLLDRHTGDGRLRGAAGLVPTPDTPPFNLGYVGWLGYELRDLGGPGHGRRSPEDDARLRADLAGGVKDLLRAVAVAAERQSLRG